MKWKKEGITNSFPILCFAMSPLGGTHATLPQLLTLSVSVKSRELKCSCFTESLLQKLLELVAVSNSLLCVREQRN